MTAMRFVTLIVLSALALACGDDPPADEGSGTLDSGITAATTGTGDTGIASLDDTGPLLDLGDEGSGDGADEGGAMGCSKVDVVISVDNSSSMTEEIAALQG